MSRRPDREEELVDLSTAPGLPQRKVKILALHERGLSSPLKRVNEYLDRIHFEER